MGGKIGAHGRGMVAGYGGESGHAGAHDAAGHFADAIRNSISILSSLRFRIKCLDGNVERRGAEAYEARKTGMISQERSVLLLRRTRRTRASMLMLHPLFGK